MGTEEGEKELKTGDGIFYCVFLYRHVNVQASGSYMYIVGHVLHQANQSNAHFKEDEKAVKGQFPDQFQSPKYFNNKRNGVVQSAKTIYTTKET